MKWGSLALICPICGTEFVYQGHCVSGIMHHKDFGYVCSRACWDRAEMKHARLILGKDDLELLKPNPDSSRLEATAILQELPHLLRSAMDRIEYDRFPASHPGPCTPESGCDTACVDLAYASALLSRLRQVLHRIENWLHPASKGE